jgi:hypothetical protein
VLTARGPESGKGFGVARTTANAWGIKHEDSTKADRETRLSDFAAFAALAFPGLIAPGIGLPANELAMLAIVGVATFRLPDPRVSIPRGFIWALLAVPGWLAVSGLLNDALDVRRLVHLLVFSLLAIHLATGRISTPSAARGLMLGVPLAVGLTAAGGGRGVGYDDRLAGWIGDPNTAAFYILTLGLLVLANLARWSTTIPVVLFLVGGVYLTLSRTGLGVVLLACIWLLWARKLRVLGAAAVVGGMAYLLENVPRDLRLWGPFAERGGSDLLRERIIAAEQLQLEGAPLYGNGPGTARVTVQGSEFFFHSSFLGAIAEGGVPLLVLLVAVLTASVLVLGPRGGKDWRAACLQMAVITGMLMAFTLGEVLLDLPLAAAVGMALYRAYRIEPPPPESLRAATPEEAHQALP